MPEASGPRPSGLKRASRSIAHDSRRNIGHTEWPCHAIMLGDRHVFADHEHVLVETEDRLVVIVAGFIGERPAVVSAGDQGAMLVGRAVPEAGHRAGGLGRGPRGAIAGAPGVPRGAGWRAGG